MSVRIRVNIRSQKRSVEVSALINTCFETPNLQILLPVKIAEKLDYGLTYLRSLCRRSTIPQSDSQGSTE